ncbi:signal peptidase I [Candidatus Nanohalobium constans]|nr:signal peptidase I [Candidatus Nanohalobium constans]
MERMEIATTLLIVLVATPLVVFIVPQLLGLEAYVVTSGSMEPRVPEGAILYNQNSETSQLEVGDIVTYVPNPNQSDADRITHRIIQVNQTENSRQFKTQGDANVDPDPGWVSDYQVIGQELFTIPYLGYMVKFLSSPITLILLLIVPSAIMLKTHIEKLHEELTQSKQSFN